MQWSQYVKNLSEGTSVSLETRTEGIAGIYVELKAFGIYIIRFNFETSLSENLFGLPCVQKVIQFYKKPKHWRIKLSQTENNTLYTWVDVDHLEEFHFKSFEDVCASIETFLKTL